MHPACRVDETARERERDLGPHRCSGEPSG
jgi:hypothetical protein